MANVRGPVQIISPVPRREKLSRALKESPEIWNEETASVCQHAADFLSNRTRGPMDSIIFDIDGTLVADETHCILPVKMLYNLALQRGYHVFIITARAKTPDNQLFTALMLEKCGIEGYNSMFMRPPKDLDLFSYKEKRRKAIAEMGYYSIMSVGDMSFDFGAYGGVPIKIPTIKA